MLSEVDHGLFKFDTIQIPSYLRSSLIFLSCIISRNLHLLTLTGCVSIDSRLKEARYLKQKLQP